MRAEPEGDGIRRVLVVDDDADSRCALSVLLADEGLEVNEADSLADAADQLGRIEFDLVVLDVRLHDGSGLDFIADVRRLQRSAKILLFTGDSAGNERSGADGVVIKGNDPAEVVRQIRALVGSE